MQGKTIDDYLSSLRNTAGTCAWSKLFVLSSVYGLILRYIDLL